MWLMPNNFGGLFQFPLVFIYLYQYLIPFNIMYYALRVLTGAVRFERTVRGSDPRTLDYKSSALGRSAMLPLIVRVEGFEPSRGRSPRGFKDQCVSQFRHTRAIN